MSTKKAFIASILFTLLPISQAAVQGEDNRIAYEQLERFNPKILAEATATQIDLRFLKPSLIDNQVIYPSGKLQNLCPGEKFSKMRTLGGCSGFLIAPDTLITAGHCYDYKNLGCGSDAWLFKHFKAPTESKHLLKRENIFRCKEVLDFSHDRMGSDFAVLKLDRPVPAVKPLSIDLSDNVEKHDPVSVLGYPLGLPFTYTPGGRILRIDRDHLQIDSDAFKNNSGSALINMRTGFVEGILTNSRKGLETNSLDGCRLTKNYPQGSQPTLVNRIKRIPYFQQKLNFKSKIKEYRFLNNCDKNVRLVVKFRSAENRDWKTSKIDLKKSLQSSIISTREDSIFVHASFYDGEAIIKGKDFYGFLNSDRQEELAFKQQPFQGRPVKVCPN